MALRPVQIVFDAADPVALADFWAAALADRGYRVPGPPEGFDDWPSFLRAQGVPEEEWGAASALEVDDGSQPRLFFQRVPEPKTVKNRVHLDLEPQDRTRDEEVERLRSLGAAVADDRRRPDGSGWVVMTDPEGNEFCVERSAAERA